MGKLRLGEVNDLLGTPHLPPFGAKAQVLNVNVGGAFPSLGLSFHSVKWACGSSLDGEPTGFLRGSVDSTELKVICKVTPAPLQISS